MEGEDDAAARYGYGYADEYQRSHDDSELDSRQIDGVFLCGDDCLLDGIWIRAGIRLMAGGEYFCRVVLLWRRKYVQKLGKCKGKTILAKCISGGICDSFDPVTICVALLQL